MFASFMSLISPNRSSQKERSAAFGSDVDPTEDAERKANSSGLWETTTRMRRTSTTVLAAQGDSTLNDEIEAGPSSKSPDKLYPPLNEPSRRSLSPGGHVSKLRGGLLQTRASPNSIQGSKSFASFGRQAPAWPSMALDAAGPSDLRRNKTAQDIPSSPARMQEEDEERRPNTWMDTTPDASRLLAEEDIPEYSPNRNYALLAQFFAEKSGNLDATTQSLTEVEVAGCLKLMEECADHGRDLESEIGQIEAGHRAAAGIAGQLNGSASIRSSSSAAGLYDSSLFGRPHPHSIHDSQSFLSPYSVSQKVRSTVAARSVAAAGQDGSPVRRSRRVVYLGPGLSSRAASSPRLNLGLKTRTAGASTREAMTQPAPINASAKRQRRDEIAPGEDMDTREEHAPPSAPLAAESTPFTFTSPITMTSTKSPAPPRSPAVTSASQVAAPPTPSEPQAASTSSPRATLTSSILRDIIKENPLPTSPRTKPTMDLVNPYQSGTGPSASTSDRSLATPSPRVSKANKESITERMARARATAAANAKLKEKETGGKRQDTLVEAIERTAAESSGGRRVRLEEPAEEEVQDAKASASSKSLASQPQKGQGHKDGGRLSLGARSEESKSSSNGTNLSSQSSTLRREEDKKAQPPQKQQTQSQKPSSSESSSSLSVPKPSAQAGNGNGNNSAGPAASFTLPAKYAASAPKKRSPLSTTVSAVPDSPEADRDSRLNNGSAAASAKLSVPGTTKSAPAPLFSLASKSADTSPMQPTPATPAPSQNSFSFATSTTREPLKHSSAQSAAQPPAPKPAVNSASLVSQEATKDKALNELPNNLPSYDFALPTRVNQAMLSAAQRAARDAALALVPKALPTFKFGESSLEAASGTATPFSNASSSIVSRSTSATPAASAVNGEATEDDAQSGEIAAKDKEVGQGEEDESSEHEVRAKAWKKEGDSWKDVGVGMLKLKRNNASGKRRMLMRSEGNGNVLIVSTPDLMLRG